MFKNIQRLISVKLNTNKNLKILSLENTFENCENLEEFNIEGFNTENIQSMKKTFFGCKKFTTNNLYQLNTKNINDMSFMFAESGVTNIDLSKYDTSNVIKICLICLLILNL